MLLRAKDGRMFFDLEEFSDLGHQKTHAIHLNAGTHGAFSEMCVVHTTNLPTQKSSRGLPILTQDTKVSAAMIPVCSHGTALPPPRATTLAHRVALIHPKKERVGPKGVRAWLLPLECVLCLACAPGQRCNPLKVGARTQNDHKARNQQEGFSTSWTGLPRLASTFARISLKALKEAWIVPKLTCHGEIQSMLAFVEKMQKQHLNLPPVWVISPTLMWCSSWLARSNSLMAWTQVKSTVDRFQPFT